MDWIWAVKDAFWKLIGVCALLWVWGATKHFVFRYPNMSLFSLCALAIAGCAVLALLLPGDLSLVGINPDEMTEEEIERALNSLQYLEDRAKLRNFICMATTSVITIWMYREATKTL
jgi:hypothetical protein